MSLPTFDLDRSQDESKVIVTVLSTQADFYSTTEAWFDSLIYSGLSVNFRYRGLLCSIFRVADLLWFSF